MFLGSFLLVSQVYNTRSYSINKKKCNDLQNTKAILLVVHVCQTTTSSQNTSRNAIWSPSPQFLTIQLITRLLFFLCTKTHLLSYLLKFKSKRTGNRRRITHVKKRGPIRDAMSRRSLLSSLGTSLTYSNNIFVPGPCRKWR